MKYYNVSLAEVMQRLENTVSTDDRTGVCGSIAVSRPVNAQQEDLILAHYVVNNEQPMACRENVYTELRLQKESTSVAELCRRLKSAAKTGSFELTGESAMDIDGNATVELLSSDEPSRGIGPRYFIQLSARRKGNLSGAGPLVKYGQPSFESIEQAVRAWFSLRPFHGSADGRLGYILIEIPVTGPRLGEISIDADHLMRIAVEHLPREPQVELSGVWQSTDASFIEPFAQKVTGGVVSIKRPQWANQVAVWLVTPDSQVTDYFFENSYRCSRSMRLLFPPNTEIRGDQAALSQIQSGECENLEFKPLLDPDSSKFHELIRTVIAFANKRGGMIYMGVSNYQEINGVEKELRDLSPKDKRRSLDDCAIRYCAIVKTMVCDRVSDKIDFQCEPVRVCGRLLIRVTVNEGRQKPYSDLPTREIWTRRGANTVRPDPSGEELKQLTIDPTRLLNIFN
jgi:hypothetical protein